MDLATLQAIQASRNEIDDEDSSLQRAMEMSLHSAPANSGFPTSVLGRASMLIMRDITYRYLLRGWIGTPMVNWDTQVDLEHGFRGHF